MIQQTPEKIFFKLISMGNDEEAEMLGTAFRLDILHLYELAADEYFEKQDYGRALTWVSVQVLKFT